MKILINKETGIPMFPLDQMLMDPSCKECYDRFGIHGLHYAVLYGWEGSPYKTKTDTKQRHDLVYGVVKHLELYDTMKNKLVKPENMKMTPAVVENAIVNRAINSLNTLAPIPILAMRNYYLTQLDLQKKYMNDFVIFKKGDTPEQTKKMADTQKVFMENIQKINKEIELIDQKIEEMFNQEKHVDLFDLIKAVE